MGLVGAGVGQRHLERRDQLEVEHPVARVAQHDPPELDVVLRADPHRRLGLDLGPDGAEPGAVAVEAGVIVGGAVGCRVLRERDGARLPVPAQMEEAAEGVAQDIVARAGHHVAAPAAGARAVGAQRDRVAAVRQQVGRLDRRHARKDVAQHARAALAQGVGRRARRRLVQPRHLARGALVQQRRHRLDPRIAHAPAARRPGQQHVGQGDDAHALVMRHEGLDPGDALVARLARRRVVERLDEAVAAARLRRLETAQVGGGAVRRDLGGERGGVGRDHQLVDRRAAQGERGNALRRVLVGEGVVAAGVGRFGDAPGHVMPSGEGDLLRHRRPRRRMEDAAVRLVEHQRRHQVLEHRSRPGAQAGEVAAGEQRPAERGPVGGGHVALGDRPQAGGARLGGEQVVEAGVELMLGDAKADVEEAPLAVVEEG